MNIFLVFVILMLVSFVVEFVNTSSLSRIDLHFGRYKKVFQDSPWMKT